MTFLSIYIIKYKHQCLFKLKKNFFKSLGKSNPYFLICSQNPKPFEQTLRFGAIYYYNFYINKLINNFMIYVIKELFNVNLIHLLYMNMLKLQKLELE